MVIDLPGAIMNPAATAIRHGSIVYRRRSEAARSETRMGHKNKTGGPGNRLLKARRDDETAGERGPIRQTTDVATLRPAGFPSIALWWAALACLYANVHFTVEKVIRFATEHTASLLPTVSRQQVIDFLSRDNWKFVSETLAPAKGILFLLSLIIVLLPVIRSLGRVRRSQPVNRGAALRAVAFCVLTGAALWALGFVPKELLSMGQDYGRMSLQPFLVGTGWYNKRLLAPALGHILFFRGANCYLVFHLVLLGLFLFLQLLWLERGDVRINFLKYLSLCTSSYVSFAFGTPGYPDMLAFLLLLLVLYHPWPEDARLSLLALTLVAHESIAPVAGVLALTTLSMRGFARFAGICLCYATVWAWSYDWNMAAMLTSHNVGPLSGMQWLAAHPMRELIGVFFAFKLLWLFPAAAVVLSLRERKYREAMAIGLYLASGLALTFLAVDTVRMCGFGFLGMLLSITIIERNWKHRRPAIRRVITGIYAANLVIPSLYVGLNSGVCLPNAGLYAALSPLLQFLTRF